MVMNLVLRQWLRDNTYFYSTKTIEKKKREKRVERKEKRGQRNKIKNANKWTEATARAKSIPRPFSCVLVATSVFGKYVSVENNEADRTQFLCAISGFRYLHVFFFFLTSSSHK